MADYAMPSGSLREPGAWVVDTRLLTAESAPAAALERTRPWLLMPPAEDATAARLQSLWAAARATARPHGRRRAAWAGSRT